MSWRDGKHTAAERGYGARWQKASKGYLRKHPLCEFHRQKGLAVAATLVDHKIPHRGDMALFWDRNNWQGLCDFCHNSTKKIIEHRGVAPGADSTGRPTDPNHPWNR